MLAERRVLSAHDIRGSAKKGLRHRWPVIKWKKISLAKCSESFSTKACLRFMNGNIYFWAKPLVKERFLGGLITFLAQINWEKLTLVSLHLPLHVLLASNLFGFERVPNHPTSAWKMIVPVWLVKDQWRWKAKLRFKRWPPFVSFLVLSNLSTKTSSRSARSVSGLWSSRSSIKFLPQDVALQRVLVGWGSLGIMPPLFCRPSWPSIWHDLHQKPGPKRWAKEFMRRREFDHCSSNITLFRMYN